MIKCTECGYENMDGLDYCDGCGAKLAGSEQPGGVPAGHEHTPAPETPPSTGAAQGTTASASDGGITHAAAPAEMKPADSASELAPAEGGAAEASRAPTGEIKPPEAPPAPEAGATAEAPPFKAKLSVIRGGRRGQEFELETGNNLVGRWDPETGSFPEVDLDADDPEAKISRKHALIRIDGGKITIEDIGSLNGTYVNRQPRLQPGNPTELKTGDEIIIGKTFLKLVIDPIS